MDVNQRLKFLIKKLNLNITSFSKEIGISQSSIRNIVDGENQPSAKVLIPILERYPELNANWLLVGTGEIFFNEKNQVQEEKVEYKTAQQEVEALKKEIELLRGSLKDKEEIIRLMKQSK